MLKRIALVALFLPPTGAVAQNEPPPPLSAPVPKVTWEQLHQPTPCDIRKITKTTKGADGKEILTTEMTADCGYDSNQLAKSKYIIAKIKEMERYLHEVKEKPSQVVIREIRYERPVDRTPKTVEAVKSNHMVIDFVIGILKGIKEL